jgi:hypothetical protein
MYMRSGDDMRVAPSFGHRGNVERGYVYRGGRLEGFVPEGGKNRNVA